MKGGNKDMVSMEKREIYNKIVDKYADMIFRIAYQNLNNKQDAEDIMQEVFLSLLKTDTQFEDFNHIKAWLIKVTVNKCIDVKKSFFRQKTVPLEEEIAFYNQKEQDLLAELNKLPDDYRNIIYLYYYESYTIAEIAKILGKKQNTVNSKLQRGRKKLKIILQKGGYNNETGYIQKCNE